MRWQVKVDAGRYLRVIRHPAARLPPPLLPTSHHPPAGWFGLRSTRLQQILCLRKSVLLLLQLSCAFNLLTANQPNWEISSILTSWTISRKSMSACPHNISTESKGFLLGGGRVGWGLNSADCTPSYWPCDYSIVLITNIPVPTVSSDNCRHASCFTQMLLSNGKKMCHWQWRHRPAAHDWTEGLFVSQDRPLEVSTETLSTGCARARVWIVAADSYWWFLVCFKKWTICTDSNRKTGVKTHTDVHAQGSEQVCPQYRDSVTMTSALSKRRYWSLPVPVNQGMTSWIQSFSGVGRRGLRFPQGATGWWVLTAKSSREWLPGPRYFLSKQNDKKVQRY